ncbi:MAG: hypothetical protein ACR2PM_14410 [Hyphomicrobiales bacterium]
MDSNLSRAGRFLKTHGEIRERVLQDPEFGVWRNKFKTVVVDDMQYFIMGGDMLKDEDELILEWARQVDLVTEDTVRRFDQEDPDE